MESEQLNEMPFNLGDLGSFYSTITNLVSASEKMDVAPVKVRHNVYKIVDTNHELYYYKDHDIIISGVFLTKISNAAFKITAVGKHPDYRGSAPYVTDLYRSIIKDLDVNQVLLSDTNLTNDSIKIWKRLAREMPEKIYIYDRTTRETTAITNPNELNRAFGKSPDMVKYQFMVRGQRGNTDPERIQQLAGIKKE